jgi:hypothetical protein
VADADIDIDGRMTLVPTQVLQQAVSSAISI